MAIRAVVFDFGGVLIRTEDYRGREKWEARLGLPPRGAEKLVFASEVSVQAQLGQADEAAVWRHVADTLGLGPAELEQFRADFWSGERLDEDLLRFLGDLRPRYRTAILSNAWPNARRLFERFGLDRVTNLMVISAEEGVAKPDPRIYQILLERLAVAPEEVVFVDDMPENVAAARTLGMHGVHFRTPEQAVAAVREHLDRHGPSFQPARR